MHGACEEIGKLPHIEKNKSPTGNYVRIQDWTYYKPATGSYVKVQDWTYYKSPTGNLQCLDSCWYL